MVYIQKEAVEDDLITLFNNICYFNHRNFLYKISYRENWPVMNIKFYYSFAPFNTYTHFVTHKRRRKYGELKHSWFIGYEVALLHSTEILFEVKTHTFIYIDYVTYMYRSLISHKTITLNMRYLRKTWISVAYLQFDTLLVNILTTRIVERVMWVQTMDNNFS